MGLEREFSGISLNRLLQSRVVLSRGTDTSGTTIWVAQSGDRKAVGRTRIEALDRVREMSRGRRDRLPRLSVPGPGLAGQPRPAPPELG